MLKVQLYTGKLDIGYCCYLGSDPNGKVVPWMSVWCRGKRHQDLRLSRRFVLEHRTKLKQRLKRTFPLLSFQSMQNPYLLLHLKLEKVDSMDLYLMTTPSQIAGLWGENTYHENLCWLILPVVASLLIRHLARSNPLILDPRSPLRDPNQNLPLAFLFSLKQQTCHSIEGTGLSSNWIFLLCIYNSSFEQYWLTRKSAAFGCVFLSTCILDPNMPWGIRSYALRCPTLKSGTGHTESPEWSIICFDYCYINQVWSEKQLVWSVQVLLGRLLSWWRRQDTAPINNPLSTSPNIPFYSSHSHFQHPDFFSGSCFWNSEVAPCIKLTK